MKQQIKFLILFLVGAFVLSYTPVFASPPAPASLCQITGTIKSVSFKDAYDEPCLKEPYGCPTDTELHHPARYYLDVSINSVAYINGGTNLNSCENMYQVGSVKNIFINKDRVKIGDTFSVNQKIEGIARSFWGSSFDSYILKTETPTGQKNGDNEENQENIIKVSKVNEKLINENHVEQVNSISLQASEKTYNVTATKIGKLFFFIPVRLNIQMTVDATNGEIKEMKKSWWAFLVSF